MHRDELPMTFGKYLLTEKLATGGMAEIYLAKLIGPGGFEKLLVIKQIHPELGQKAQFVEMFVAEAKTLVSLSHGNIVPIYELGVVDRIYFIAMEYIDGPTLRQLSTAVRDRDACIEPQMAAYIVAEMLKGLSYAHHKGVIHRDLSPRNVMLSRDGEVKLVDFGIAVREDQGLAASKLIGSYPYMSPEQVSGEALSPRSDLFSAGVLLWELLTGRELFARPSAEETLEAVLGAEIPRPSLSRPGVPPELDAICGRALTRDPHSRYASASEFLAAVSRYVYAGAEPVTAEAVANLVARWCPPVALYEAGPAGEAATAARPANAAAVAGEADALRTRKLPGEADALRTRKLPRKAESEAAGAAEQAAQGMADAAHAVEPAAAELAKASQDAAEGILIRGPLPPRGARGKGRAPTVRTFATNVEFRDVLAKATPLLPFPAIVEEGESEGGAQADQPDHRKSAVPAPGNASAQGATPAGTDGDAVQPSVTMHIPRRTAGARRGMRAGLLVIVLTAAGTAWLVWPGATTHDRQNAVDLRGTEGGVESGPDAAPEIARSARVPGSGMPTGTPGSAAEREPRAAAVAGPDAPVQATQTSQPASTPVPHAGAPWADAQREPGKPAHERAASARTVAVTKPAAERPKAAPGMLKVGANPWGEVYVDGRRLGRAPNAWTLPAGRYKVDIVLPLPDSEQRRSFAITVRPGETVSLGIIDFSKAAQDPER